MRHLRSKQYNDIKVGDTIEVFTVERVAVSGEVCIAGFSIDDRRIEFGNRQ